MKAIRKIAFVTAFLLMLMAIPLYSAMAAEAESVSESESETAGRQTGSVNAMGGTVETEDFSIRLMTGLDGEYRYNAAIPVRVEITSLTADFEGIIRIIVPGNSYYGSEATAFEREVLLTAGEEKAVNLNIYNQSNMATLYFQVEDEKGRVVLERKLSLSSKARENALIGVLSEDYAALNDWDSQSIVLDGYDGQTQLIQLDEESMPEMRSGLDALSYLIVNSFDTSLLTAEQMGVLEDWVSRGGVLIIGTGPDYQQTLSGFGSELVGGQISGMTSGELRLAGTENGENDGGLPFDEKAGILSLTLEGGEPMDSVLTQEGLVWQKDYGQGRVVVTAFNLGMQPLAGWESRTDLVNRLLTESASGYPGSRIGSLNYGNYSDAWSIYAALRSLYEAVQPNKKMLGIILVVFALLPTVLYPFLKKADKREWLWLIIPAAAFGFSAVILLSTSNMRIRYPIESSLTLIRQEGEGADSVGRQVYMGIMAPSPKEEMVNINDSLSNLAVIDADSYYYYDYSDGEETVAYTQAIRETAKGYQIRINNRDTFETKYFSFDHTAQEELSGGLVVKANRTVSGISGSVTNETGYDLKAVTLLAYGKSISLGAIEAGGTAEFTENDNKASYGYNWDSFSIPDVEENSSEFQRVVAAYQAVNDMYIYGDLYGSGSQTSIWIMGYIQEWPEDYVDDANIEEYNAGVYLYRADMGFADYPDAKVLSLSNYAYNYDEWDPYDGQLYDTEAEVEFVLGEELNEIYALVRAKDSEAVYGTTKNTVIYGWNWETEQYDEFFKDDVIEKFDDGCPYLSDEGILKLKMNCQTSYENYSPVLTVVGGEE